MNNNQIKYWTDTEYNQNPSAISKTKKIVINNWVFSKRTYQHEFLELKAIIKQGLKTYDNKLKVSDVIELLRDSPIHTINCLLICRAWGHSKSMTLRNSKREEAKDLKLLAQKIGYRVVNNHITL